MIIAHYPGAGGHRYGLFLKKLSFDVVGSHMHQAEFVSKDCPNYITNQTPLCEDIDPGLIKKTHTLNDALLQKFFPKHKIVKIKADFKQSLHRQWQVVQKKSYGTKPIEDQVSQMFSLIEWHHNYYAEYPVDWNVGTVIDIATDTTEFGQVMRRELDLKDPLFDLAWNSFIEYGPKAPIVDLYKKYEQQNSQ